MAILDEQVRSPEECNGICHHFLSFVSACGKVF